MKVICVIPARYQSTRLPGKPLLEIAGKPMIQHVVERASQAKGIAEVIVATDDKRIFDAVRAFGGKAVMTSSVHRSGTDRLAEVVAAMPDVDIVVNVQGDEPLVHPKSIELLVGAFSGADLPDMATLMTTMGVEDYNNPAAVKVVVSLQGDAIYFSRSLIPFPRVITEDLKINKHVGMYAYRREFLLKYSQLSPTPLEIAESLEQLRGLEHGYRIKVIRSEYQAIGVDTPEDLDKVRRLLSGY